MSQRQWTTLIEEKIEDGWQFFSQQSIKPGEAEMTDEEYLAACRKQFPGTELRIAPSADES